MSMRLTREDRRRRGRREKKAESQGVKGLRERSGREQRFGIMPTALRGQQFRRKRTENRRDEGSYGRGSTVVSKQRRPRIWAVANLQGKSRKGSRRRVAGTTGGTTTRNNGQRKGVATLDRENREVSWRRVSDGHRLGENVAISAVVIQARERRREPSELIAGMSIDQSVCTLRDRKSRERALRRRNRKVKRRARGKGLESTV
jgi:hypothetical protein